VEFVLKPFLRAQGINRLDRFALSHGDVHNVGGASQLQSLFRARKVFVSKTPFRSQAYREQLGALEATPGLVQTVTRGDRIGTWSVLHPAERDRLPQAADNSLVLRGDLDDCRVLLLSDLGKPGQHLLLSREKHLAADVVVSGLPSQSEPLAEALLDAVDPQLIIITDSEYPATQRASPKLRARLESRGIPILYTRDTGAITLTSEPGRWSVRTMNGIAWQFLN
jgi:competence protein ComEC